MSCTYTKEAKNIKTLCNLFCFTLSVNRQLRHTPAYSGTNYKQKKSRKMNYESKTEARWHWQMTIREKNQSGVTIVR
jgi:hypothetical protein